MKRSELLFSFLLVPVDAVAIVLAFVLAYVVRSQADVVTSWPFPEFFSFVVALLPLWIAVFALEGLYNVRQTRRGFDEFRGIVIGALSGIMLVVAWLFLTRTFFFSRLVILYALVFSVLFVALGRWLVRWLKQSLYRYGIGVHRLAFIGLSDTTSALARELAATPSLGYRIVGAFSTPQQPADRRVGLPLLGSVETFATTATSRTIDDVIVTDPHLGGEDRLAVIERCEQERIDFRETPTFVGVRTLLFDLADLAGVPLLTYYRTPLDGWGRIVKRLIDIVGALIGLIVLAPLLLLIALAIALDSPGPILYRNRRIGENAQPFFTLKFRTMDQRYCTGSEYGGEAALRYERALITKQNTRRGALYKVGRDPRVTRVGRFVRRLSLDEFPQLWNVLVGQMSLVGPRPHQPREVARYEPWHKKLFSVKPGMTGLAAVSGRSDLDFDDEARLDISYIESWSIWKDLQIILRTPLAVLLPRKVE